AGLPGREITFSQALLNLSMLQEFFFVPSVDSVYWTLAVELCFYAIMFVLYQARLLARIDAICCGWVVFVIVNQAVGQYLDVQLPGRLQLILLSHYAHLFVAGIMLYQAKRHGMTVFRGAMLACCVVAQWYLAGPTAGIYAGVALGCLLAASQGRLQGLAIKPLVFFGTISYSLYLLHQNIGYIVLRSWYAHGLSPVPGIIITVLIAIGLASSVTFFVERPAMKIFRRQYRRFQERNHLRRAEMPS
ncbi:MAG: acyltransferase, partial [Gammaproteobacteria bacterium]|nr:acyltransferase [Gammaproteobacteria bacterium]